MLGSAALRKLLSYDAEGDLHLKRPYHYSTHYEHIGGGLTSCSLEYPSVMEPPNGLWVSVAAMGFCLASCILSRKRHQEAWWMGGLGLSIGYYGAMKSHKVGNGPQGHLGSLWTSLFALLGMAMRAGIAVQSKARITPFTKICIGIAMADIWFELGRFHMWSDWVFQFKRRRDGRGVMEDVWAEYVPAHADTTFHHFTPLQAAKE